MQSLSLNEIRSKFLQFFGDNEHLVHPSFPLIPQNDKSLLLINAGMVPLKEFFSGALKPPAPRMATCQKCIRTNDIDNVGLTSRHASFFEMLGNFSFGDYFKERAIDLAWRFVTEELEIPKDKLWVTVYTDDDEAYDIWLNKQNVPAERIVRLGKEDNFWEIGSGSGPCGPCSEIYFDRGAEFACSDPNCKPGCDCDRYVEFWNLVFTQFNQQDGQYLALENPNIDTGMGLERVACLMQNVDSIFDIDVMVAIRNRIASLAQKQYGKSAKDDTSIRKICDHIRAVTFLVTDGVTPNNEGRGYILRRLLRRAARHGRLLGIEHNFLAELCDTVIDIFGEAYPDLIERRDYTKKVIALEEDRFAKTIDQGLVILDEYIKDMQERGQDTLSGELAFKLYDTYGFPLDLTLEILSEKDLKVDEVVFNKEMKAQRERARNAAEIKGWDENSVDLSSYKTEFIGYDAPYGDVKILALLQNGQLVDTIDNKDEFIMIVDQTPFYAESGGQVGDCGIIQSAEGKALVYDTQKDLTPTFMHHAKLEFGKISVDTTACAAVDVERRRNIARNHSATHLLHKALRDVLGDHITQAGSLVNAEKLRFDFNHFKAMTPEEIEQVENAVNREIFKGQSVETELKSIDEAKAMGAMALFGEKYGDVVRVVEMGDYSIELCGGTHCGDIAEIGSFKITSEGGVSAGVRRIEAITGLAVLEQLKQQLSLLQQSAALLKTKPDNLVNKIESLLENQSEMARELAKVKQSAAKDAEGELLANAKEINGIKVIIGEFSDQDSETLRNLADKLVANAEPTFVLLANLKADKINFVTKANKDAVTKGVHCGKIIKEIAKICGGGGGGRPDMAEAGAKNPDKLAEALSALEQLIA